MVARAPRRWAFKDQNQCRNADIEGQIRLHQLRLEHDACPRDGSRTRGSNTMSLGVRRNIRAGIGRGGRRTYQRAIQESQCRDRPALLARTKVELPRRDERRPQFHRNGRVLQQHDFAGVTSIEPLIDIDAHGLFRRGACVKELRSRNGLVWFSPDVHHGAQGRPNVLGRFHMDQAARVMGVDPVQTLSVSAQ